MQRKIIKNKALVLVTVSYVAIVVWWVVIWFLGLVNTPINYYFAFSYATIPLIGGIFGILNARHWGMFKSAIGKSVFLISLGLVTWSIGQVIFSYYNLFLNVAIPYPSIADVSFILSWPLWGAGVYYLSKATGAKYGLKTWHGKYLLLGVFSLTIPISYYLLVIVARGGTFDFTDSSIAKIFFDVFYPLADVVVLTLVSAIYGLSYKFLGGKFKIAVHIIFLGIIVNYFADFSFTYTTTLGTFFSADWVDLLFATAMYLLSVAVTILNPMISETE